MPFQPQNHRQLSSVVAILPLLVSATCGCGSKPLTAEEATAELADLIYEADSSDMGRIRELIEYGADVNATDESDSTPLDYATNAELIEIVELLLENGADIRGQLIWASEQDYIDFVKLFLDHKADVNATDEKGNTALHYAMEEGNSEIVKVLREHGAK